MKFLVLCLLAATASAWSITLYEGASKNCDRNVNHVVHSGTGESGCIEIGRPGPNNDCAYLSDGGSTEKACDGFKCDPNNIEISVGDASTCSYFTGYGPGLGGDRDGKGTPCDGGGGTYNSYPPMCLNTMTTLGGETVYAQCSDNAPK